MTIYDAAMAIVVVLGMVRGAWRGFTWQVASIASLILGYAAAHSQSARFASYLPGEPEVQRVLAMAVVYLAVSGGIFALAWMVRGTLRKLKFEAYDRHLGTLLGGIEGVGVGLLVTMVLVSLAPRMRQPIFSSPTGRVVGIVMNSLGPVLPDEVRQVLAPHWEGERPAPTSLAGSGSSQEEAGRGAHHHRSEESSVPAELPPLDEAVADPATSRGGLPSLPALEEATGTDPAVQPASTSASRRRAPRVRVRDRLNDAEHRVEKAVEGAISSGADKVEQTIDEQLRTLGGLESAPQKGPR
jgi:membrane protein required for colicin V production